MIKSEIANALARANPHLPRHAVARLVDVLLEEINDALAQGRRIELRGFGVLASKWREPHQACNPRSGEKIQVRGQYRPVFKSGKVLRERLNHGRAPLRAR